MSDLDLSKIDIDSFKKSQIIDTSLNITEFVILIISIILVCLVIVLLLKKADFYNRIKVKSRVLFAILSGWGIWCILVYSYSQLFEEYLDYSWWFTLPPLCTLLCFIWYKTFITNRKS